MTTQETIQSIFDQRRRAMEHRVASAKIVADCNEACRVLKQQKRQRIEAIRNEFKGI